MKIEIDTNVPIPAPGPDMAVGDSFAVPLSGATSRGEDMAAIRLRGSAIRYARTHGGKFTVRTDRQTGEARCWRVE